MRTQAIILLGLLIATPIRAQDERTPGARQPDSRPSYFVGKEDRLEISVNVWGEVTRPGIYRVPDDTDLVSLISVAGGPTEYANLRSVKVTRMEGRGAERLVHLDLAQYLETNERSVLPPLRPGDTVRVTRNARRTWASALRTMSEIAVIASTYVYITDRLR